MTPTEEVEKLLDERGVEHDHGYENHVWWRGADNVGWHAENRPSVNGSYVKIEAVLTPAQAIAATLGRSCESCPEMDNPDSYIRHLQFALKWHDEHATVGEGTCHVKAVKKLGDSFGFILSCGHSMVSPFNDCPHYCPWCGAKVVGE